MAGNQGDDIRNIVRPAVEEDNPVAAEGAHQQEPNQVAAQQVQAIQGQAVQGQAVQGQAAQEVDKLFIVYTAIGN